KSKRLNSDVIDDSEQARGVRERQRSAVSTTGREEIALYLHDSFLHETAHGFLVPLVAFLSSHACLTMPADSNCAMWAGSYPATSRNTSVVCCPSSGATYGSVAGVRENFVRMPVCLTWPHCGCVCVAIRSLAVICSSLNKGGSAKIGAAGMPAAS